LLFDQVIVAIASPLLVDKLGPPDRPETLQTYALLHDAHDIWPAFLERAFPTGAPPAPKNIRFNQTSLAIEAAIAGQGLALASQIFVAEDLASGRLVQPLPQALRTEAAFNLVFPRKPRHPDAVQQVRDWLIAQKD
jgi:LysR family glycine cleavage system transcriptional activator